MQVVTSRKLDCLTKRAALTAYTPPGQREKAIRDINISELSKAIDELETYEKTLLDKVVVPGESDTKVAIMQNVSVVIGSADTVLREITPMMKQIAAIGPAGSAGGQLALPAQPSTRVLKQSPSSM